MDLTTQLPAIASAVVAVAGAGVSVWGMIQAGKRLHVDETAAALEGFNQLCQRLQERIEANEQEMVALREELAQLRSENEELRRKVRALEQENVALRAQLDELQKKRTRTGRKG